MGRKASTWPAKTSLASADLILILDPAAAAAEQNKTIEYSDLQTVINDLVDARIAALQASGDLIPAPAAGAVGDGVQVNASNKWEIV